MVVLARDVLRRHPGAPILADVKASQVLFDEIARMGGRPVMAATGHSLIKAKLAETGAPLAGEMSGHISLPTAITGSTTRPMLRCGCSIFYRAAVRSLAEMRDRMPRGREHTGTAVRLPGKPEIRSRAGGPRTLAQAGAEMNDIDGVRVRTRDGWWLLRASNTQAVLVARAESATEDGSRPAQAGISGANLPRAA